MRTPPWRNRFEPPRYRARMTVVRRPIDVRVNFGGELTTDDCLGHDPHEKQHQLEDEDEDDGELEELAARHRALLDREAIDVVERLELRFEVSLPRAQAQAV